MNSHAKYKNSLETSVKDVSSSLKTSVEDSSSSLKTSVKDASSPLETSVKDSSSSLKTSVDLAYLRIFPNQSFENWFQNPNAHAESSG
jgi:hypothetical protein